MRYAFFSAANATAIQEARREAAVAETRWQELEAQAQAEAEAEARSERAPEVDPSPAVDSVDADDESENEEADDGDGEDLAEDSEEESISDDDSQSEGRGAFLPIEEGPEASDPRTRVLSVLELEDLFLQVAPDLSST